MAWHGRKVYGQSKKESCVFCSKIAITENSQGFSTCSEHKTKLMEQKTCSCGQSLEVKKSKYGAFYVCNNCGPVSQKKADEMINTGFKLNKKYREKEEEKKFKKRSKVKYEEDRVYTLGELDAMWSE